MTEIINPEEVQVQDPEGQTKEVDQKRLQDIENNIRDWSGLTEGEIIERVRGLKFIVDPWGTLDDYKDVVLEGGFTLATTSRHSDQPGTITIAHPNPARMRRIRSAIKTYVGNHGLTLAQADTFIETLYFAKFTLLPLLIEVLNDKNLYTAYRAYSRDLTRKEYIQWVRKYDLQNSNFNIHLSTNDRARLSELLNRMVRADKILRPMRDKWRAQHQSKLEQTS